MYNVFYKNIYTKCGGVSKCRNKNEPENDHLYIGLNLMKYTLCLS